MHGVRMGLLAGVSALAIAAANPEAVQAADMPSRPALATKAPPATFRDRWSWWVEGGASALAGDPGVAGMTGFDVDARQWGWEGAIGFSYQQAMSPWIWSAQFRYGQHGSNTASNNPIAVFPTNTTPSPIALSYPGTNSAARKEHHWAADFMIGRDLGIGGGQHTARFGVRIAEIRGKTSGSARWQNILANPANTCSTPAAAAAYCLIEQRDYEQKNSFLGVGPRLALDGHFPLHNGWALEYAGGVAALYGRRKSEQTVNINQIAPTAIPTPVCVTGCPFATSSSSNNGVVFNLDAMLGFSYAVAQNMSLLVSYRFDGYWNALRGYDSNGNVTNLNRFYHGPMLRLTVTN
jgi:opacity protein-like surface antigen